MFLAGNDGADACLKSPASAKKGKDTIYIRLMSAHVALTVGATDKMDMVADFSNYGSCVDL